MYITSNDIHVKQTCLIRFLNALHSYILFDQIIDDEAFLKI